MARDPVIDAYEGFRKAVVRWIRFRDNYSSASTDFDQRQAEVWYLNRIGELFRIWEQRLIDGGRSESR